MKNVQTPFVGTNWLHLETAIETIGDLISYYVAVLDQAIREGASKEVTSRIEDEIKRLGKERQGCYDARNNGPSIAKALIKYSRQLRHLPDLTNSRERKII
ncbi:MAG: hypothetical protein O9311_08030 [Cytophagales bacterium]|nr:hypothetical protein [Cytophagales bacterium]